MNVDFKLDQHLILHERKVVEIWYAGQIIATIAPLDGKPGVRVISKYPIKSEPAPATRIEALAGLAVLDVTIGGF